MAITEPDRHKLYQSLESVLGPEEANTLMEHLPPVGWANVATKDGVDARIELLDVRVTGQIASLDARLSGQIRELDARLTGQIRELDGRLTGQIAAVEGNLLAAMHQAMRQNTLVTIGVLGTLTTVVTAITAMG